MMNRSIGKSLPTLRRRVTRSLGSSSTQFPSWWDDDPKTRLQRQPTATSHPHASFTTTTTPPPPPPPPRKKLVRKKGHTFVPLKAPIMMTETARMFFKTLLESKPDAAGVLLKYHQSSTGEPRMVFSFEFVRQDALEDQDEPVSLEVLEDGTPKPPAESRHDGLPKLYVHHNAFMKVLGCKLDMDLESFKPILYDREGNLMDPNNT